ncbi:hypothetical protein [Fimbriiglobus ruber]|nr:hypothetical protein [Fimbriiglobus ruber]
MAKSPAVFPGPHQFRPGQQVRLTQWAGGFEPGRMGTIWVGEWRDGRRVYSVRFGVERGYDGIPEASLEIAE